MLKSDYLEEGVRKDPQAAAKIAGKVAGSLALTAWAQERGACIGHSPLDSPGSLELGG